MYISFLSLWVALTMSFDELKFLILMKSNVAVFSFMNSAFRTVLFIRESALSQVREILFDSFSRSSIALLSTCGAVVHFKLIFVLQRTCIQFADILFGIFTSASETEQTFFTLFQISHDLMSRLC